MPILHRTRTPGLWTPGVKPSSFAGLELDRQACRVPLLASFPFIGGSPAEIVGRVKPVQTFGSWSTVATPAGIGVVGGASGSIQASLPTSSAPTTFSYEAIFTYGAPNAGSDGNLVQICEGVGSGAPTTLDRAIYTLAGVIDGYIFPSGALVGASSIAGGVYHVVYVVNPAAGQSAIYVNGALGNSSANTAAYGGYSVPTIRIGWATVPSAGTPTAGNPILLVNVWDGALTADEVRQRYADPWSFLRPAKRRRMSDPTVGGGGGTSVFFTGLARFQASGRIAPAPLGAPLLGRTAAQAAARAIESQGTRIIGLSEAMACARAPMSPSTPVAGKSEASSAAKAASALSAPLTGKTKTAGTGKASLGLATSIAGKATAAAQGRASSSSGAILSALARAGAASAGRAAMAVSATITGKSQTQALGRAAAGLSTTVAGRTSAAAQGRASSSSGAILIGFARTGGAAAGRAAASLATAIVGRSQAKATPSASPSAGTSIAGKTQAAAQGRAPSTSGAILVGFARTGGAAAGRAAMALQSAVTGITTAKARATASQGVSVILAGRTQARAAGRATTGAAAALIAAGRSFGRSAGRAVATVSLLATGNRGTRLIVARIATRAVAARAAIRRFTA